jgi:hypothetical protein
MGYEEYTDYIESFINDDINQWEFKSNPKYCYVLEHVTKNLGDEYLVEINKKFSIFFNENKDFLINLCHKNDLYGKTTKSNFIDFTFCSPSNLRYIFHSLLILTYMKECMLNNIDVIEIGGGYGGLCFFLNNIASLFKITIKSYSLFDLQNPLLLQKKYLQNLNINVNCVELDNIQNINKNSFLISNYAFSELSLDIQKKYTIDVLNPYTSYGFLAWNCMDIYDFIDNKRIITEKEYPISGIYNYYVYYKPTEESE